MIRSFTLIEVIIVIAIIAILAGIAFSTFQAFQPSLQLSEATRTLSTNLRYAQQLSVTEQVNYCVDLYPDEKKYKVVQCESLDLVSEIVLNEEIQSIALAGFINERVEFNPYGAARRSGTITIQNTNNDTKTIQVKPSGFVKVSE